MARRKTEPPPVESGVADLAELLKVQATLERGEATSKKKLGAIDRARLVLWRQSEVVRMKLAKHSWPDIAATVGLSIRGAQLYWNAWAEQDKTVLAAENPMTVVHEHIATLHIIQREAHALLEEADNTSSAIGALKLVMEAQVREIEMRQETGLMPKNLGRVQIDINMRALAVSLVDTLEKYELPVEAWRELSSVLRDAGDSTAHQLLALNAGTD